MIPVLVAFPALVAPTGAAPVAVATVAVAMDGTGPAVAANLTSAVAAAAVPPAAGGDQDDIDGEFADSAKRQGRGKGKWKWKGKGKGKGKGLVTFDVVNALTGDVIETNTDYTDITVGRFLNELTSRICSHEDQDVTYSLVHNTTCITEISGKMLSHYLGRQNRRGTIRLVKSEYVPINTARPKVRPAWRGKYSAKDLEPDPDAPPTPPTCKRDW